MPAGMDQVDERTPLAPLGKGKIIRKNRLMNAVIS
jgi:hypothetical protein